MGPDERKSIFKISPGYVLTHLEGSGFSVFRFYISVENHFTIGVRVPLTLGPKIWHVVDTLVLTRWFLFYRHSVVPGGHTSHFRMFDL